ncbi:MAG: hypothetical protein FJZ47_22285 [Candidatus Tectomicrobia bacterium]|uniref:Uncharacterized protein n=1 Tax=Tectimicrobiota bacterium TaxID=2528274 RepID=A0A937W3X9_UNCTE|nr:hypothetical protein [Candidatus Tectomicrobia bacterium]
MQSVSHLTWYLVLLVWTLSLMPWSASSAPAADYKPEGEMRWALYVTFPPAWLDPAEVAVANSVRLNFCVAVELSASSGQYARPIPLLWPSH